MRANRPPLVAISFLRAEPSLSLASTGRVGKTSILLRYIDNVYVVGRPSTMQASYLEKHVVVPDEEVNYLLSNRNNPPRREAQLSIWGKRNNLLCCGLAA